MEDIERKRARDRESSRRYRERHPNAHRDWAKQNRERVRELKRDYQQRLTAIIRTIKDGSPCAECGRKDLPPWALEFHHVRGRERFNIGRWYEASKWRPRRREGESIAEALHAEIAKCDVLCPTCHRLRHPPSNA